MKTHVRTNRPISFPSVPVSEVIEIRHGCQYISSLVRALAKLPGGIGRFLPCGVGSHMSRLRHFGWNPCSHGLTSRPLESCHHQRVKAVCGGFLLCPKGSASELLDGTLKLRHCTAIFCYASPPLGLFLGLGMVVVKDGDVSPGHLSDDRRMVTGSLLLLDISWMKVVTLVRGSS